MKNVKRITFVCHGNVCRSPMAEFIMRDLMKKAGISGITVDSAATTDDEIFGAVGNPVYPAARYELICRGLDPSGKRARRVRADDYEKSDLFVCMDEENYRDIIALFRGDPQGKVKKILSFVGSDGDVSDPWYTGKFAEVYVEIERGCKGILRLITSD